MLDIRLIRAEPEQVKARAGDGGRGGVAGRRAARGRSAAPRGDPGGRGAAGGAHGRLEGDPRSEGSGGARGGDRGTARRGRADRGGRDGGQRRRRARSIVCMLELPNLPHPDVPVGPDESANVVVRTEGELPRVRLRAAAALGPRAALGIIDFERGVKISGSRFYVLHGMGARLQRALITWMLDLHTREHGYVEVYPPSMVRGECLVGTGQPAQVRRQPLPRRRGGLLVDPHRRGAGDQPLPRRDPRRRRRCRSATSPTRRASGARRCPPGATCAASSAATSSTRSSW